MQNPIRSGHSVSLANQRFQQAISQQALHRATSNASQRILSRDPTQIFSTPSLLETHRPKLQGRRLQTAPGHPVRIPSTMIENIRLQQKAQTEQTLPKVLKQRQYAQASRILRNTGKRAPVPGASPWPPGSVFEYGSPANRQLSRRIESRLDAIADWLREQVYRNEKHPVRTEPLDLPEQLAKEEAKSGRGRKNMEGRIKDPKYKDTHDKMEHIHDHGDGTISELHYWKNRQTGKDTDHKFKDPPYNNDSRSTRIK